MSSVSVQDQSTESGLVDSRSASLHLESQTRMMTEWLDMAVGTEPNPGPPAGALQPGDKVRLIGSSQPIGVLVEWDDTGMCSVQVDENFHVSYWNQQIEEWVDSAS